MDLRDKEYRDVKELDENEWQMNLGKQRLSRSRSSSPIFHRSSSNAKSIRKRFYSPLDKRSGKLHRHSRSRSPRVTYNSTSSYISPNGRGFCGTKSRSRSKSPSSSIRRIDLKEKISDTSLFAELVKDKHKRDKALKEILERKEEVTERRAEIDAPSTCSLLNKSNLYDDSNPSNGLNSSNNMQLPIDIVNIPIPESAGSTFSIDKNMMYSMNNKYVPDNAFENYVLDSCKESVKHSPVESNSMKSKEESHVSLNDKSFTKINEKLTKIKSLTKLPMPPGINPADLDDIKSPISPDCISPVQTKTNTQLTKPSEISKKKGLLDLPMPYQTGFDELSGDDDAISPKYSKNVNSSPVILKKRPQILHRKSSLSLNPNRDWGERCVDVFEVIAQIGEGTYGQV